MRHRRCTRPTCADRSRWCSAPRARACASSHARVAMRWCASRCTARSRASTCRWPRACACSRRAGNAMREEPTIELQGRIAAAQSLFVLTGAGMSAESGIATFRDAMTGLWSRFDPAQLASEEGFRADPARVWDWYPERRDGVRTAQPNAGHRALGAFARRRPGVLTLVSQNVDDLHQRAGNTDTIRLHGDIQRDQWLDRCTRSPACDTRDAQPGRPPRCARCGNLVRPGVVWFGEMLPVQAIDAADRAAGSCDVALIV